MAIIPTMLCKTGCNDCCGIVPFSKKEKEKVQVRADMQGVSWEPFHEAFLPSKGEDTLTCVFWRDGCSIYEDRPMICKLFGAVDTPRLTCPHGCGPDKKISNLTAQKILNRQK